MISITTQTAGGYAVTLNEKPDTRLEKYARRNSVRATLDGGGVPSDFGYSDTGRVIEIVADMTQNQKVELKAMIQSYVLFNVSTPDGFYVCMINSFEPNGGKDAYIRMLIT